MSKFRGIFDRPPADPDDTPIVAPGPSPALPADRLDSRPEPTIVRKSAPEPRRMGRPPGKRSAADFTQVTAYVRRETHHAVKVRLLADEGGREFSDLVEALLGEWLTRPAESPRTRKSGPPPV